MPDPTITCDGEFFYLLIPSTASAAAYTLQLPVSRPEALVRILLQRERSAKLTIGTEASPTQQMVDEFLRAHGPTTEAGERAKQRAAEIKEKYGFDLDEIELDI